MLELIMIEVEVRSAREIHDREHRAKRLLQTRDISRLRVRAEELLVALALNLDEVRHFADFVDVAEDLADPPLVDLVRALVTGCVDRLGGHVLPCAVRSARGSAPLFVIPAKAGTQFRTRLHGYARCWSASPVLPPQCVEPVRLLGPCPGEDGKSPGRTLRCGQSRYVLDVSHIVRWPPGARATRMGNRGLD